MTKSTHKVEVIKIENITKHPNADRLQVVQVFGYTCCVGVGQFDRGQLAAYIPPDSVVDSTRPEFAFLAGHERIKVKKLRGIVSMGLLIPAPPGSNIGDDVADYFGVTHYEPRLPMSTGGETEPPPAGYRPAFDVDSLRRYGHVFTDGEPVWVTEKIHGCVISKTLVSMADGSRRKISAIQEGDVILGVDKSGRVVPSTVMKTYKNGKAQMWLRVSGQRRGASRGSSFFAIYCTGEHKFWNPIKQEYIEAEELKVGDRVLLLRSELGLTPIQEQVLLGKMLGDGSYRDMQWTASIHWGHREQDREYAEWTASAIGSLDSGSIEAQVSGYGTNMVRCRTVGSAWIKEKFSSFFSADRRKRIPSWVAEELSPISLAFWYMDDGSLGKHQDQEDRAHFAVCGFTTEDCNILIRGLKRFGIAALYYEADGYSRIRLNATEAEKLFLLIAPYIPPVMQRKLPERYRGHAGWIPSGENEYKPILVEQTIESITKCPASPAVSNQRYDLETTTGNYFANGVLVHNSSARYCWHEGRMYCGSRTEWKREDDKNIWWLALRATPQIAVFCENHPDITVYAEVYGPVQDLKYGTSKNEVRIAVFDLLRGSEWIDPKEAREIGKDLPWVPLVHTSFPFDLDRVLQEAEGKSLVAGANHLREGVVIKPQTERTHPEVGRVCLKIVSNGYLERA